MPNLLDANTIRIAAAAQRAAYGEGSSSVNTFFESLLNQSGWALNGPYNRDTGFYINGNAAAFAVRRGDTVVISIRGSATELNTFPGFTIGQDWYSAVESPQNYYDRISGFISSVLSECDSNTKIILTGHSLGAQAATICAIQTVNEYIVLRDINADNVSVVLFGTPNIPLSTALFEPSWLGSRMMSFVNSDDIIPIAVPTHISVEPHIVAHFIDENGGFDRFLNTPHEHNQAAYYQLWTDISYFEFFNEWRDSYHSGLNGIYALNSNVLSPNSAFDDQFVAGGLTGLFLGLFGNDTITLDPLYAGTQFASGGQGNDTLIGGAGTDYLDGGSEVDHLSGGAGADFLAGGSDDDRLSGQGGNDRLIGGTGSDRYNVGLNEGFDTIDDRGGAGEDVLVLYVGEVASTFDPSWFARAPDNPNDLLIRIPNGPDAWHVDIRVVGAGMSGGEIETIEIRSGAPEVVTASTSLTDIWSRLSVPAPLPPPVVPDISMPESYSMGGGSGRDLLNGSSGTDTIAGLAGYDRVFGHGGNDVLLGGSTGQFGPIEGDPIGGLATPGDVLDGGDGDDLLIDDDPTVGRDGDYLAGGTGDDTLLFYGTSDSLDWWLNTERGDGGAGHDIAIVDYRHSASSYSIRGSANGDMTANRNGVTGGLILTGCETITFLLASGDDQASGGSTRDRFFGGAGNDQLDGADGDDVLDGGDGDDQLISGSGVDWLDGGSGTDRARLDLSDETRAVSFVAASASGEAGFTLVDGTHVRNVELFDIYSGTGADRLTFNVGLSGQHSWAAGAGVDHLTIDQSSATTAVTFSVNSDGQFGFMTVAPTGAFGFVGEITFTHVDRFSIIGGAGDDDLNGGQLADELSGGRGEDRIIGNSGDDTLRGGAGDDILTGGLGNDWLDGGAGHDIVTVSSVFSSYRLLKHGDDFILKGPDGGDRLTGVESIRFSDGRVLELSRMYGPDVDTRGWADGRVPEALLSGGVWDGEQPLVLPGPGEDAFLTAKDGAPPEVLPEADDGDRGFWKDADTPLVLPGVDDVLIVGNKGFGGPEVLPGVDDSFVLTGKTDLPPVLPPTDEVDLRIEMEQARELMMALARENWLNRFDDDLILLDEESVFAAPLRGEDWQ